MLTLLWDVNCPFLLFFPLSIINYTLWWEEGQCERLKVKLGAWQPSAEKTVIYLRIGICSGVWISGSLRLVKAKCLSFSWLQTQLAKGLFDFQEAMQRMSKIYLPIEARVWSGQRRTLDAGKISTRLWVTNCDQSSRVTFATDRCKSTKEIPLKWHLNEWFCNILGKLLKWQPN